MIPQLRVNHTIGMKGFKRLRLINKYSGKCRVDTGWFPNAILDSGRNALGTESDVLLYCQVGTGDTPPTATDAGLETPILGTTSTIEDYSFGNQSTVPPYYGYKRMVFRHPAGTIGNENITEAGIGWAASGTTLFSRALVLDPILQTPTSVTPLPDEMLDVHYELRYYGPTGDVGGSIVLDGVTYDTVTRVAEINTWPWSNWIGQEAAPRNSDGYWVAYDGALGTVLQNPSGNSANMQLSAPTYSLPYSNNSYEVVVGSHATTAGWNLAAGIRCLRIRTSLGSFQTSFTANPGGATVPKNDTKEMIMEFILNWAALT